MKKRTLAIILAALMAFSLTACGSKKKAEPQTADSSTTSSEEEDSSQTENTDSTAAASAGDYITLMLDVTEDMTTASYWSQLQDENTGENIPSSSEVVASSDEIESMNQAMLSDSDTAMYNLENYSKDLSSLASTLSSAAQSSLSSYAGSYYDENGSVITQDTINSIISNISGMSVNSSLQYGICVKRSDLKNWPTSKIITDEAGDTNFDYVQSSFVRVNEPAVVMGTSADGAYYYLATYTYEGWVAKEDVAICSSMDEWKSAWQLDESSMAVVTADKLYLEKSNVDSASSELVLTMGTQLEVVKDASRADTAGNRNSAQNLMVYIPTRTESGAYQKEKTLIAQSDINAGNVSIGYLPMTTENILNQAFKYLGKTYGWGGMLDSVDCSGLARDVYACFGLMMPRDSSKQSATPAFSYDVSGSGDNVKKEDLDKVPAGSLVYFPGHEMIYLGKVNDHYYVISAVSSINATDGGSGKIRSVVISTLDGTLRGNGSSWLSELTCIQIPYKAAE
jgi:cell wall-associated NlpC family hydrolase/predicted small lipoprotein YifL